MNETARKECILLIEDEPQIRRLLRVSLERSGYQVVEAPDGETGIGEALRCRPDAVLLDLGLPDLDGMTVLQRLREWSQTPILVVSVRDQDDDKIKALDGGANDYLTKPFSTGELLARLRAARRSAQPIPAKTVFRSGPLTLDLTTRSVKINGRKVRLTATEYSLLLFFVRHAGKVLTHQQILRQVWGPADTQQIGYLRVYMAYLREKLEADPGNPALFLTEPGIGYRLALDD